MNRTIAAAAFASIALLLLPDMAVAGSGVGKGMVAAMTASGTVANVYPQSMSFSCHCGSSDWTFVTNAGTVILKGGSAAGFADIAPGASVEIQYHFAGAGVVTDRVVIGP